MSIPLQRSRVIVARTLDPYKWRRYCAVNYRKSVTLLLSVKTLKTKILYISAAKVSDHIYFRYKLKTSKAYLSCCVAAFESTMLTSTASHMILLWGTPEEQWCCNDKLFFCVRWDHCSCCHLQPKFCIYFHLLYIYRILICACVHPCVYVSSLSFLLSSFQHIYLLTIWHPSLYIILQTTHPI